MNNINEVLSNKADCVGCRACANSCPAKAITMKEDEEGFFYPAIDEDKCTHCGLCKKACPALNKSQVYEKNQLDPACYAIMADDDLRLKSSSGGAFSIIAEYILEQGGVVCGVAYGKNGQVHHIIIEHPEDLDKLRGSKYVQSNTETVYAEIRKILKTGKKVLFSGTPCQVAGLNTYLGKEYDNLYTVDIFCHGVPPQKVFDMYLKEETEGEFIKTDFRDKVTGWDVYTTTTTTTDVYSDTKEQSLYLNAFLKNMCLRPSCATCKFTTSRRESDITIGDFWAIDRYSKKLNDKMGTSAVLTNSPKGKLLFDAIKNKFVVCEKVPIEYAKWYNWTLYRTLPQHPNRQAFFRMLKEGKTLKEAVDYCNKNKCDCALLGVWPYNNYGSALTMFALQEAVKSLNYIPKVINYHRLEKNNFNNSLSAKFAKQYLDLTSYHQSYTTLSEINKETTTFIVGSDCMWHPHFYNSISKEYPHFLSFAYPDAKKIAYATSFGTYDSVYASDEKYKMKYYLDQFDRISTREQAGIEFCKKNFNLEVEANLDPVFLHDRSLYEKLANESTLETEDKYIALCNFWPNMKINKFLKFISDNKKIATININDKKKYEVCDWLKLIKNCELIITHSFHAMCFAIIFNKPFIVWKIPGFDKNRYLSLLQKLGLEKRLLVDISSIANRPDLFEPINWDKVNAILAKEKERSLQWLKAALEAPKDLSKINPADAVISNLMKRVCELQGQKNKEVKEVLEVINYNKIYRKYLKYKLLKNLLWGKAKKRYKRKAKEYHQKIKTLRRLKKDIKW